MEKIIQLFKKKEFYLTSLILVIISCSITYGITSQNDVNTQGEVELNDTVDDEVAITAEENSSNDVNTQDERYGVHISATPFVEENLYQVEGFKYVVTTVTLTNNTGAPLDIGSHLFTVATETDTTYDYVSGDNRFFDPVDPDFPQYTTIVGGSTTIKDGVTSEFSIYFKIQEDSEITSFMYDFNEYSDTYYLIEN